MKSHEATPYDEAFFDDTVDGSLRSARAVVPAVLRLVQAASVAAFGCGRGAWLRAFLDKGVEDALGLDGDYVDRDRLLIDASRFREADLRRPIRLGRRFDLALCLEVGEHLPARSASALVESLAAAAPVVLFSAALPGQGGTSHVNERWPVYWERLFNRHGMRKHDVIRPLVWRDRSVKWWYRQNLYLYAEGGHGGFDDLDRFEPEMTLVSSQVMTSAAYPLRSRLWRWRSWLRDMWSSRGHGPACDARPPV